MIEVRQLMAEVIKKLSETTEYNQYHTLLERVKAQPDLYHRISEFRKKSLALQLSDNVNPIQANNNLQNEFGDLQNNGLANDFLVAEHQYCTMVRSLQEQFLDGVGISTDFMEE
ncbi:MAG: YlbF family regulator [Clostridiaceae bacterium]|nr:YlbF family regulator [Clostridiaceae bacterium]